jgi:general stress protein 26
MLDQNKILSALKKNSLSVISTADLSGKTESAVMMYAVKDDLSLIMCTAPEARKLKNLVVNPQVSVAIGGFQKDPSLQIDGTAKILSDSDRPQAMALMLSQHPEMKDFGIESETFISITPNWVRYIDYSQDPDVEEISL